MNAMKIMGNNFIWSNYCPDGSGSCPFAHMKGKVDDSIDGGRFSIDSHMRQDYRNRDHDGGGLGLMPGVGD
jgi:hypothetical protein